MEGPFILSMNSKGKKEKEKLESVKSESLLLHRAAPFLSSEARKGPLAYDVRAWRVEEGVSKCK